MKRTLKHIKANGEYYWPQKAGVKDEGRNLRHLPVCLIKKLAFGRWRIDYFNEHAQFYELGGYSSGDEDTPNTRLILYPSGIEEVCYITKSVKHF